MKSTLIGMKSGERNEKIRRISTKSSHYIPEMIALLNYRYLGKEEYDVEVHGILLELFSVLDKECNKTVPEILQVEYPTFELKDFANCIVYGG